MNNILAIVFLFIITTTNVLAQKMVVITSDTNQILPGDSIFKYQIAYIDPGLTGEDLKWDFSRMEIKDENYLIKYSIPDSSNMLKIAATEHRTHYYYHQESDSLWAIGFENYTTQMLYSVPELKMTYPFTYGDTLYSEFEGEGVYSNLIPLHAKGYTRIKADATGFILLPNENKKHQTLRIRTTRHYTEVGKDSIQMVLDTYAWYIKGIRYPIVETITTSLNRNENDTTVFRTSFFYSPTELRNGEKKYTDDIVEIATSTRLAASIFTEATLFPNPVIDKLTIEYKLTKKAQIGFSLHNNIGQPMLHTSSQTLSQGWHREVIPMNGLPTGSYTLYVLIDDMLLKRVIIKK